MDNNTNTRTFVQVLVRDWDYREDNWDPEIVAMSYDLTEWDEQGAFEQAHCFIGENDLGREPDQQAWIEVREIPWVDPPKPKSVSSFKEGELPF